jgi:hypothetical protein
MLPSKTKETAFQILNRTIWTNNKAFKSGIADSPNCKYCNQVETMEHLLLQCENYSELVWSRLGEALTLTLRMISGADIARIELTPLHIIFNKPHTAVLTYAQDTTSRNVILRIVQEVKRDIIYRKYNMPYHPPDPVHPIRINAHLSSVIKSTFSLLKYQGANPISPAMTLLSRLKDVLLS